MLYVLSGLIWVQTIWHFDGISERIFLKSYFLLKKNAKKHAKFRIMRRINTFFNAESYLLFVTVMFWTVQYIFWGIIGWISIVLCIFVPE